jgi:hypothetical protein
MENNPLPRTSGDEEAERLADEAAAKAKGYLREELTGGSHDDMNHRLDALRDHRLQDAARDGAETSDEELSRHETMLATDFLKDALQKEKQELLETGEHRYRGRRKAFIDADLQAVSRVSSLLTEGSLEEARQSIIDEWHNLPALRVEQGRWGNKFIYSPNNKNITKDGTLSPEPIRIEEGGKRVCEDYYIVQRALHYIDFMQGNPDEVRGFIDNPKEGLQAFTEAPLVDRELPADEAVA